jgi:putative ABC transport system permease protein
MRLSQVLRRLVRMPLFTSFAVLTLAMGIGANTAIFSVIEGVLLKPLPYPRAGELVVVDHAAPGMHVESAGAAPFQYFTYREDARAFQDIGLWQITNTSVTGLAEPEEVPTLVATDAVLPMLGVQPLVGRLFTRADDTPATAETVVLMAGYWRSKFGGDRSAVGRTLMVNGRPREIIGVTPDSFRFLDRKVSLVLPQRFDRSKVVLGNFSYQSIARLKPDVSMREANADVARLIPVSLTRFPPFAGLSMKIFEQARLTPRVRALKADLVGNVQTVLWVLMGTIAIVLLIAGANVANLLLVRAESRQQELAVRAALGAGAGQIARELLVESLALGVVGGAVGLGFAAAALRLLLALAPANLPRLGDIGIDASVLLFTLALSLGAGLVFGAIPVFKYAGSQIGAGLRGGGRSASASRERHRARNTLVVSQVALAMVLLVSSALMIRTFMALKQVRPGFARPQEIQTFRLAIPAAQVKDETATVRMHQAIVDRIAALPGVTSVALTSFLPMTGLTWHDPIYAEDHASSPSDTVPLRLFKFVTPGFAAAMGGSLVSGRDFTWDDIYDRRAVLLVSESLARDLWSAPSAAIGKRLRPYLTGPWREVVGVVSDLRDDGVHEKAPAEAYFPMLMEAFDPSPNAGTFVQRSMSYLVRSRRTGSLGFLGEIEQAVWSVNPNLPVAGVRTLQEIYDASLARTSFTLVLLAIAGGMALLLGVAGIYGVISYSVTQRTREIGIRLALGAGSREVTRMFVRQGVGLAACGVAIGLTAAFGAMRLMASLLFEVSPVDPITYAQVAVALLGAAVLASYVPALRATLVSPVESLRAE